jgi:hypothetical protein
MARRGSWKLPVIGALAFHLALAAFLVVRYMPAAPAGGDSTDADRALATAAALSEQDKNPEGGNKSTPAGASDPASLLQKGIDAARNLSLEEQEAELRRQVDKIGSLVSESAVPEVGRFLEKAAGVTGDDSAFVPNPQATGNFDDQDCVFHDIVAAADEDGAVQYEIVMVDRGGRVLKSTTSRLEPSLQRLLPIFNMVRDKPALRSLVTSAWRIGDRWEGVKPEQAKNLRQDAKAPRSEEARKAGDGRAH